MKKPIEKIELKTPMRNCWGYEEGSEEYIIDKLKHKSSTKCFEINLDEIEEKPKENNKIFNWK